MAIVLFYFIELCGLYFLSLSALFACLSDFIFPLMPPYTVCSRGVGRADLLPGCCGGLCS